MAKKEEVLELLATEDPMEAGLVISFVKDVPPEDDRFQRHFGDGKAALGFWLEEKEKSEGAAAGAAGLHNKGPPNRKRAAGWEASVPPQTSWWAGTSAAPAGQGQMYIQPPMLFTESEFRRLADVQPLDSLACSRHAELLPEVAQQFLEWVQKNKQSCVELLNSGDFADDKIPECRAEPDHVAYRAHGEMFRKLISGIARIDLGLSAEDWEQHPIHNFLIMDVDEEIYIMGGRYGDRKPDCSVLFGLLPDMALNRRLYKYLVLVDEMVVFQSAEVPEAKFESKLAHCLDSVARACNDRCQDGFVLPFEVSDGRNSRCGLGWTKSGQLCAVYGSLYLKNLGALPDERYNKDDTPNVWWDRLLLAFTAYKQLPPQLVMKAAAFHEDRVGALGGTVPLHDHMVSAGSVVEVEVPEPQLAPPISGFSPAMASSPASCSNPTSLPHSAPVAPRSASSVSTCSPSHPSQDIASDATGRASASSRHAVRIDATLIQRQLYGAQSLVLRGTSLTGTGSVTPKNVVLRLMCGTGLAVNATVEQWDREVQSLRLLQGAGAPYLPSLVGCGVVTAGPPSVIGASALITARLGNPLPAHLMYGTPMHARYVLLLAACLSAACYTLMAKALIHGDIRPDNITATMDAHMRCSLFHLVDLGASCSAALNNDPSFRGKWAYPASRDLSREAVVADKAFSSLNALRWQPLLPCADLEAAVYTLVFLASGALPWVPGPECPEAGRQRAMSEAAAWGPLATLPPPVASFAAWVLGNAMRETAPLEELRDHTASLFRAVHQELGLSLPWPAGIPGQP